MHLLTPRPVSHATVTVLNVAPIAVSAGFPSPAHCVRLDTVQ